MTLQIESTSSAATEQLAETIGQRLKGREIIELISDLGGGKTTFVRGMAKGMGSKDRVASPTFTISKVYKSKDMELHHFDFYRLQDAGLLEYELHDLLDDQNIILVVEWGEVVQHVLPEDRLTIEISRTGEEKRQLTLTFPESLAYLTENL